MNERTPYKPVKPVDRSSEIDELRKKMEKLYEELEELKREKEELKGSKISLTPQQVQEEMDKLILKGKQLVRISDVCPRCALNLRIYGCGPLAYIEGGRVVFGVQCNERYSRGFEQQGEIPIPKHLREYI